MAIERALGRAIPREKAPPGTKRRKVVKAVADVLRVDLPVQVVVVEVPAKIDYTNNPFLRIDSLFSKLEQTKDVVNARVALRMTQGGSKDVYDQNKAKPVRPIIKIEMMGLFQGSPDTVDRIIKLMKRDGITSRKWSKENGDQMASIKTDVAGIKLRLSELPADKKNPSGINRLYLVADDTAVIALKDSPPLPDLEPAKK